MSKAINKMTAEQIQARLVELDSLDAEHESQDFDSELSEALMNGGDVDSLEQCQLDAERQDRRLRIERQALTAALPEAKKREAQPQIDAKAKQLDELATEAAQTSQQVMERWQELQAVIAKWMGHRIESVSLTREAAQVALSAGLPIPQLGAIVDRKLFDATTEMREAVNELLPCTGEGTTVGRDYLARELSD